MHIDVRILKLRIFFVSQPAKQVEVFGQSRIAEAKEVLMLCIFKSFLSGRLRICNGGYAEHVRFFHFRIHRIATCIELKMTGPRLSLPPVISSLIRSLF